MSTSNTNSTSATGASPSHRTPLSISSPRLISSSPGCETMSSFDGRLVVISNRFPVSLKKEADGTWSSKMSSGGLVAALSGLKSTNYIWVGWIGSEIDEADREYVSKLLFEKHKCIPVFLSEKIAHAHYNGFSNGVLWPLFHYLPGNLDYEEGIWDAYVEANQQFADVVLSIYSPDDLLWVHDYHLMLMPEYIKKKQPDSKIGFFLHIPFPSSEIFRVLPCRKEILNGMLHSNLIGFHTYDYARHFFKACTRMVGLETAPNGVYYNGQFIPVGVFPVGIDPDKFFELLQTEKVKLRIEELKKNFEGQKIIIGIDRLDYIKGLPQKLEAMEKLFQKYPQWKGKLVLIQVAVPSRQDVEEYQKLKQNVEELVGRINGLYGSLGQQPIHYLFQSVDMSELTALYSVSDACLITSIRDGMNLVAQEYVSCQTEKKGVLILSEFTGAAQSLSGALIVNPWNTEDVADSINEALLMSEKERAEKHSMLFNFIIKHTASHWGNGFVCDLYKASNKADKLSATPELDINKVIEAYNASTKRLLVLTYDGALIPFSNHPRSCKPSDELLSLLKKLSSDSANEIYLMSGRDKKTLGEWFNGIKIGLSAEFGCFTKRSDSNEWEQMCPPMDPNWKDSIRPLFKYFTIRTPGSFFEEKEMLFTWHYRNADFTFGAIQARELHLHLDNLPLDVIVGEKTLGVRSNNINPATAIRKAVLDLNPKGLDYVLMIGDTHVHQNDLPAVNGTVCSVSVGKKTGKDAYYLSSTDKVIGLLSKLCQNQPLPGCSKE